MTTSDPFIGTLFGGRWLIERPLMSGGMGSVYVAKHSDTGRPVALKVIKSGAADDPNFVGRFRRETGALAAVSHPNVVGFLDSGLENGNLYLVMELLQGKPLRELMRSAIEWRRAFRIAADVCRALAAVHKLGIIHRDLKPENVFLQDSEGHDEFAKLIDFGIARLQGLQEHERKDQHEASATQTGVIVGTPGYISPEQLRGKPATPASDVYAVGVIIYELVTGVAPFGCMSTQEVLVRQLIDPIVPPIEHVRSLPLAVNAAILRLMERDPEHRVQSARDAITLLVDSMRTGESGPVEALPSTAKTEAVVISAGGTLLQGSALPAPFAAPATSPTPAPQAGTPAPLLTPPVAQASVPAATTPPVEPPVEPKVNQALITTALVDRAPAPATKKAGGRWGRRFLWAAALGLSVLPAAWIANEGLRVPRNGADVTAFYHRVLYPTGERIARVVTAGARAAHVEASGGTKKPPAPRAAQVEALVRRFSGELIQCGGDSRPRIVRATLHPSGRIDAVTSPDDDAARCLRDRSRAWRSQSFDGNAVTVDVQGVLFGVRAP